MVGWFKKKKPEDVPLEVEQLFNEFLWPSFLMAETAENISKYFKRVRGGEISFPAYKRKDTYWSIEENVMQVWMDTRLELLQCLWKCYDNFNPAVLVDLWRQRELLAYIKEADLKYVCGWGAGKYTPTTTAPSKELNDMINVIIMMYETSLNIADEIGVEEVDIAMGLKPKPKINVIALALKEPFEELESNMGIKNLLKNIDKASAEWLYFRNKLDSHEASPSRPKTIFEIIFEDISRKSKLIALTAKMGPCYGKNFSDIKRKLTAEDAKEAQEMFDFLISADKPEDYVQWRGKRN